MQLFPAPTFFLARKTAHTSPCFFFSLSISKSYFFFFFLLKQPALDLGGRGVVRCELQDEFTHLPTHTPQPRALRITGLVPI